MPRPLRPIAEGLIYHVINQGNNRARVFLDDDDYRSFLDVLSDLKERRPFHSYGYCLMSDHFHLLLQPLGTPISRIVQSLLVSHTHRHHRCHGSSGHVWQGRFKSPVVQNDDHVLQVLRYIEANPLHARLVRQAGNYPWSSFAAHGKSQQDPLLDRLTAYTSLAKTEAARQRRWSAYVHKKISEKEPESVRRSVQTGLPFGSPAWTLRLSRRLGFDLTIRPRGRPRKDAPPRM